MLKTVLFNVTRNCTLRCKHCSVVAGISLQNELSFIQIAEAFKKLNKEWGVKTVILMGGEPFIKPKIMDIILVASELFKNVHIETNGMVVPCNIVEYIQNNQINNLTIFVSIEDSNKVYNDNIRGEGHLEQAIITIKKLKQAGIPVAIRSTLFSDNDYKGIINLAGELGVKVIFVRFLQEGRGKKLDLMPNKERIKKVYEIIKNNDNVQISDCPYYLYDIELIDRFKDKFKNDGGICQVLRKSRIIIDSDGIIYPCVMLLKKEFKLGNILKNSKEEILKRYDKLLEGWKELKISESCKGCKYFELCKGGCYWLHTQNEVVGDPSCFMSKPSIREVKSNGEQ